MTSVKANQNQMSDVKKCKDFEYNVALWYKFTVYNYRGQYSSAMTRSNTADNCNFMDNQFRMYISTHPAVSFPGCRFAGEQHWRSAL
ncbi:hypothetical protein FOT81_03860 [Raoultella planticola]|nr:hypothetical protein [Raoultella planticola]MBE0090362.1 hypothetical protein [Raoultella planticola]MBZ7833045.1 hypothetical protein [Raoultella planticola]QEU41416.1 hypothetical protein F3X94_08875 [Raoultella planticola]TQN56055.1 hypothetical protein FLW98_10150 [Raoultella planticola]